MSTDAISAIKESLPPASDYLTYLTILESHLSPEILPTLNELLQDVQLTQNIGWDLIQLLLPLPGAEQCLTTIARLGNPREVVLKVTEALQIMDLDAEEDDEEEGTEESKNSKSTEPTLVDRFCILTKLLSILLPRIKTKYPSRFLSTSLMALLATFRPSDQATLAVISFVHTISGKKRPPLPGRKSSLNIPTTARNDVAASEPDPEAQEEDPKEAAIQTKLLQSFVTHVLEEYVNANSLEWAARFQEHFDPAKVVTYKPSGRMGLGQAFKEQSDLQVRDTMAGQLVALARDLGLTDYDTLFTAIEKTDSHPAEYDTEENHPTNPNEIPLSQAGSLFLIISFIFSSIQFDSKAQLPKISIFPDHAKLVKHFIGTDGQANIGNEEPGVIDAILAIGIWLEETNQFVGGPLEDEQFLEHLQSLSLLSANNPSPSIRYAAHALTSSILHAHPMDQVRLVFITDTLEHCPYESLKASAVSWFKEEIITSNERKSDNVFSSTAALAAAQPYLFPDTSALADASADELLQEMNQSFTFHMAIVNFLYFAGSEKYAHLAPSGMFTVVEEIYLGPLKLAVDKALASVEKGKGSEGDEAGEQQVELQLLGDRISLCVTQIAAK